MKKRKIVWKMIMKVTDHLEEFRDKKERGKKGKRLTKSEISD